MMNIKNLRKGAIVTAIQARTIAGTPEGTEFDLQVLGWHGKAPEFKRVDTGQVIPWVAFSRGFVRFLVD